MDVCRGWSGLNQIICESMLHAVGHVEGMLKGVGGVDPVCIGGSVCKDRLDCSKIGCSKMKQLGQDSAGEARKDGMRGNIALQQERRPQPG